MYPRTVEILKDPRVRQIALQTFSDGEVTTRPRHPTLTKLARRSLCPWGHGQEFGAITDDEARYGLALLEEALTDFATSI
jgi:hypothetical protein